MTVLSFTNSWSPPNRGRTIKPCRAFVAAKENRVIFGNVSLITPPQPARYQTARSAGQTWLRFHKAVFFISSCFWCHPHHCVNSTGEESLLLWSQASSFPVFPFRMSEYQQQLQETAACGTDTKDQSPYFTLGCCNKSHHLRPLPALTSH